jgi:hypothetical protein
MTISIPHHHVAKPTEAQAAAGNYKKAKLRLYGLDISIENPKGSTRSGKDPDGKEWRVTMPAHYGYVRGSLGHDGDHVDVYIGPNPKSDRVYIVNQIDAKTKKFDEHKCMLGYSSRNDALKDYIKAFSDGKGRDRMGGCVEMPVEQFKTWVKSHNTKAPARSAYAEGGAVIDRSRFSDELSDPAIRQRLAALAYRETGGQGPQAQQAFLETVFNRAAARGKSIADVISGRDGYYPSVSLQPVSANKLGGYMPLIDTVAAGSNLSNGATGNASGTVGFNNGRVTYTANGERFGIEGPDLKWATPYAASGGPDARYASAPSTPLTSVRGGPDLSWTKPYSDPEAEKTASPLASLLQKYTQPSSAPIDFDGNVRWGDGSAQGLFNPANMRAEGGAVVELPDYVPFDSFRDDIFKAPSADGTRDLRFDNMDLQEQGRVKGSVFDPDKEANRIRALRIFPR